MHYGYAGYCVCYCYCILFTFFFSSLNHLKQKSSQQKRQRTNEWTEKQTIKHSDADWLQQARTTATILTKKQQQQIESWFEYSAHINVRSSISDQWSSELWSRTVQQSHTHTHSLTLGPNLNCAYHIDLKCISVVALCTINQWSILQSDTHTHTQCAKRGKMKRIQKPNRINQKSEKKKTKLQANMTWRETYI